jgi:hypothetical protein
MTHIHIPKITQVTIRQECNRVLVIEDGRTILDLPYDAALALSRAIHIKAKLAEEWASAEAIVSDQAILTRLGVPLGLTNHPALLKKATMEAAWNSKLRRYIPPARAGGIASQAVFGTPTIFTAGGNR